MGKFSDKINWSIIFFVISLLLIEYVIIDKAYNLSNNSELISFLSFAGTLTSIILALVAIVYTFFEGVSQKSQSNTIQNQIEVLKETVKDVDVSKNEFASELKRLDDINSKLDHTIDHVLESKDLTTELTSEIIDFKESLDISYSSKNEVDDELLNKEDASKFLESMNIGHNRCFLFAIRHLVDNNKGWNSDYYQLFAETIMDVFNEKGDFEKETDNELYNALIRGSYVGILMQFFNTLKKLGFLDYDKNSITIRSTLEEFIDQISKTMTDKEGEFLQKIKEA